MAVGLRALICTSALFPSCCPVLSELPGWTGTLTTYHSPMPAQPGPRLTKLSPVCHELESNSVFLNCQANNPDTDLETISDWRVKDCLGAAGGRGLEECKVEAGNKL